MNSSNDVSGAAHFPGPIAANLSGRSGRSNHRAEARRRGASVAHRRRALEALLKPLGEIAVLGRGSLSRHLAGDPQRPCPSPAAPRALWRISVAPSRGHEVAAAIGEGAEYFLRLGRRPDLGGAAGGGRWRSSAGARGLSRRPRYAGPRARRDPRGRPRCSSRRSRPCGADQAGEGEFRPEGRLGPGRMYAGV